MLSFLGLFLALAFYLFYSNNPLVYDDLSQLLYNNKLHNVFNLKDVIFCGERQIRVFQNLTLALDWTISGINPWASRVQNLLWFFLCVYYFLELIEQFHPLKKSERYFLYAFFLVLPIQIQNVHYAMARTTLIQCFFYFSLSVFYLKGKNRWLIALEIILSTLCKETCALIPVLFIAYDFLLLEKKVKEINWKNHVLFFLGASSIFIFYYFLQDPKSMYINTTGFGLFPFGEYLLTQFYYFLYFIYIFFAPSAQSIIHEYPEFSSFILVAGILGLGLIFYSLMMMWKWRNKRKDLSLVILLFFTVWFPVNSFLQMINPFAEYRYLVCNLSFAYLIYSGCKHLVLKYHFPLPKVVALGTVYFLFNLFFLQAILAHYTHNLLVYGYALALYPESPRLNLLYSQYYNLMASHMEMMKQKTNNEKALISIEELKRMQLDYLEKAYSFYHKRLLPKTIIYDVSLMNEYNMMKNYSKSCEVAKKAKIENKFEVYYNKKFYYNYLLCLKELGQGEEKFNQIFSQYEDYTQWAKSKRIWFE